MLLFVDGFFRGISCPNLTYTVQEEEQAFAQLTQLVVDGWTLLSAVIVDNSHRIHLPVDAFDGQPIHSQALQKEWNQLLQTKPILASPVDNPQLKAWCLQLDTYYEDLLTHLGKMISMLEVSKHKSAARRDERVRSRLDRQCSLLLEVNKQMQQQTKSSQIKNRQLLRSLG